MAGQFDDIVEVTEVTHPNAASRYLAAGYRLLHLGTWDQVREQADGRAFNVRRIAFVMGRTVDVAHFEEQSQAERLAARASG